MPELPEVETIRQDLQKVLVGKKILSVWTDSVKQIQPSPLAVEKAVVGRTITKVGRRAKMLQIFLDNGQILTVHLKLTGRLLFRDQKNLPDAWTHVILTLSEGKELRLADTRKFGWIKLIKNQKELEKILSEFGPEPLDDLTEEKFSDILGQSGLPVKIVLMDQQKISGVGNIYANEALFLAKIDPRKKAKSLTGEEKKKLFEALEQVLKLGLKYRGASDQYYLDAFGKKGSYQNHFLVYQSRGQKCSKCGSIIKRINLGGRGTFYCPGCQR